MQDLKAVIRQIPDWPKQGILFYDVTTLLKDGRCFRQVVDAMVAPFQDKPVDLVVGIEARGFIFAPPVAYALNAGFVPVRKPGKLPPPRTARFTNWNMGPTAWKFIRMRFSRGNRVLIVDDLIATGGTAKAVVDLFRRWEGSDWDLLSWSNLNF